MKNLLSVVLLILLLCGSAFAGSWELPTTFEKSSVIGTYHDDKNTCKSIRDNKDTEAVTEIAWGQNWCCCYTFNDDVCCNWSSSFDCYFIPGCMCRH